MIKEILGDLKNIQTTLRTMKPTRELASAITKLDEARHWLVDHVELTEEQVQEILK